MITNEYQSESDYAAQMDLYYHKYPNIFHFVIRKHNEDTGTLVYFDIVDISKDKSDYDEISEHTSFCYQET